MLYVLALVAIQIHKAKDVVQISNLEQLTCWWSLPKQKPLP